MDFYGLDQNGVGGPRRTHPGLGLGRGSLDIHDVHFLNFFNMHTSFARILVESDHPSRGRPPTARVIVTLNGQDCIFYRVTCSSSRRLRKTLGAVIWRLGSEPGSSSHCYMGLLVRE
eukprot:6201400-Pleurochrysis_carterae.AAC.1